MTRFRRNHPRIEDPSVFAVLPQGHGSAVVKVRDLSVSGASLLTDATLPMGAVFDLDLREEGQTASEGLVVRARVARRLDAPEGGMAVEFVERRPGDTFRLLDLVDRHGFRRHGPSRVASQPAAARRVEAAPEAPAAPPAPAAPVPAAEPVAHAASESALLEAARAEAHAARARAEELEARVHGLEEELAGARRELAVLRHADVAPKEEPREVTLGPETVRSVEDFTDRIRRGARLRLTDRFRTLQPVTRVDFQLADWLRSADRLSDLDFAAQQLGGVDQLAAAIYRFFERGLVRITR